MIWRASYTGTNMKNNVTKRTQHKRRSRKAKHHNTTIISKIARNIKMTMTPTKTITARAPMTTRTTTWRNLWLISCSVHRSCTTCHGGQSRRQFHGLHIFPVTWLQDGDSVFCFLFCAMLICDLSVTGLRLYATQIATWSHQCHETWSPVACVCTLSS